MRIALVTNYAPDGQQSMLRFGDLLRRELVARGHEVTTYAPRAATGDRWLTRLAGQKWAGYAAKYLSFPSALRDALHADASQLVHVVDHSNAVYVPTRRDRPWVVTCHDLLAVRGALGEDTDCPASFLGRRLQHAIVRGLARADAIACDSQSTLGDADRLVLRATNQHRTVIPLGLNQDLRPPSPAEAAAVVRHLAPRLADGFLLHVGSNLRRKNKPAVLRVLHRMRAVGWRGGAVLAGAPLDEDLRREADRLDLAEWIVALPHVSETELAALYRSAHALVFPSKCEGFGWPVLEALACDCPVICSDRTSLPEVGGDAAFVRPLEDEAGMAADALALLDPATRAAALARGRVHAARFSVSGMVDAYLALYEEVLRRRAP